MTIIKELVAKNFKSFAKKVEIPFGEKFNVVIGPNGSGKSNIVDALCFVLGKSSAKGLRAEKSANLIYNGGKDKDPAKEAEVSIFFDNEKKEFPINTKEVKISRFVRHNGTSIYKINDETRTRQQVVDLLGAANIDPDGHNIMLQGDIIRFTEMRGTDRREIIEEVAGISVYEDKKEKALSELNTVQNKLNEVEIIMKEREGYLRELKKDRDQAIKYKEIEQNVKSSKATYLSLQIKDKETLRDEIEGKIKKHQQEIESIAKKTKTISDEVDNFKKQIETINSDIELKGEKEQIKLNKEIDDLKTTIIKNEAKKENLETEIGRIKSRKEQLEKNVKDIDEKIIELEKEKENLKKQENNVNFDKKGVEESLKKIKEKLGFSKEDDLNIKIDDIEKEIEEKQRQINTLHDDKEKILRQESELQFKINSIDSQLERLSGLKKEDQKNIEDLKDKRGDFKKVLGDLEKALDSDSKINNDLGILRKNLILRNEDLVRLNARQISAKEFILGDLAIKKVLELKKGIFGTVGSLGNVSSRYSLALEVAAGARIKSVVVEDEEVARKCINYLKENKLGVVTFLPLNKIKPIQADNQTKQLANANGVKGLAVDLVKYDAKFKNVFSYVFGNTLVIDDLNVAKKIGIGNARMVTLEGDLVETSGAMIGGYRRKTAGSFKEGDVEVDILKLEKEVKELKDKINKFEDDKIKSEEFILKLKEKKSILEVEIVTLEKKTGIKEDMPDLKKEKQDLTNNLKSIQSEVKNYDGKVKGVFESIENLKNKRNEIRKKLQDPKVIADLNQLEELKQKSELKLVEIRTEVKNIEIQLTNIHLAEKERIKTILKNQDKEVEQFEKEIKELGASLEKDKKDLKEKEISEKKFLNDFKGLFNKRNIFNDKVNKRENFIAREQDRIKFIEQRVNTFAIDRARIIGEIEGLNAEFEEFKEEKIRRGITIEQLRYEIKQFENQLKNIGNVNLRALEVYEKVNEEYGKLQEKVDTLKMEKEEVINLMNEIDSKKASIFMKSFRTLEKNFAEIFSQLSTKGQAHLEIEDPEHLFESGVDIKVKLTTKKFMDIKSLSGGEKTMAALAFIFAIQENNPASFYIMDEVDAALDKRNSELLSKLIEKYAANAQYIVISHNDSVITEADRIYGISMQEGISKVISLKI